MAHPLRIQILVELNKRPMSPARFTEEVAMDADLRRVARQFRVLELLDCIELAEVRTGRGRRRGRPESIYRAVRSSLFDESSWLSVPPCLRAGVTGAAFSTYIERIAQAATAGTLDARDDRHFSWTDLLLDEQGWAFMIAAIDSLFWYSLDLRVESALRIANSQTSPIPVTVGLACIEAPPSAVSPTLTAELPARAPVAKGEGLSPHLAKALAHPLRIQILVELNKRPMSRKDFMKVSDEPNPRKVAEHLRLLEQYGCIELWEKRSVRGGMEHVFRATQRSLFDESSWAALPQSLRGDVTGITFTTYIDRVAAAMAAETIDRRDDRHFTWTAMQYDEVAWAQLTRALETLLYRSLKLQDEAVDRSERNSSLIPVTTHLACIEAPRGSELTPTKVLSRYRETAAPSFDRSGLTWLQGED